mmetsp:Transcript_26782/g.52564  ORF Transcript_26782/g.52564 Transcript_26782/m.52564 type:complete len:166 (+) Transcript_26782:593-1090(+)
MVSFKIHFSVPFSLTRESAEKSHVSSKKLKTCLSLPSVCPRVVPLEGQKQKERKRKTPPFSRQTHADSVRDRRNQIDPSNDGPNHSTHTSLFFAMQEEEGLQAIKARLKVPDSSDTSLLVTSLLSRLVSSDHTHSDKHADHTQMAARMHANAGRKNPLCTKQTAG